MKYVLNMIVKHVPTILAILVISVPMFGLWFTVVSLMDVLAQHGRMTGNRHVRALVEDTSLDDIGGSDEFHPVVVYRYEVDGQSYTCDDVYPIRGVPFFGDGAARRARDVISPFVVGQETDAWYDPAQPDSAFLIRSYTFFPYGKVLSGLVLCIAGLAVALETHRVRKAVREPRALPDGWYRFVPPDTLAGVARRSISAGITWLLLGASVCSHFFAVAARPYGAWPLWITGLWIAAGLAILGYGLCFFRLKRSMDDACLLVDRRTLVPGDVLRVRVEQRVHKPARVREMTIKLECSGGEGGSSSHNRRKEFWSTERRELVDYAAQSGELLEVDVELPVPPDAQPSLQISAAEDPWTDWKLHQTTKLYGHPAWADVFDVIVELRGPDSACADESPTTRT